MSRLKTEGCIVLVEPRHCDVKIMGIIKSFFLFPIILSIVFAMEAMQRGSFLEASQWAMAHGDCFLLSVLLVFLIVLFLAALFGSLRFAVASASALLGILALISRIKFDFRGEPLFPWDLFLNHEGFALIPVLLDFRWIILLSAILGAALLLLIFFRPRFPFGLCQRVLATCIILPFLAIFVFGWSPDGIFNRIGIRNQTWNPSEDYRTNGFLVSFFSKVYDTIILPPSDYGQERLLAIASKFVRKEKAFYEKPNLVIVQSESFWDPSLLSVQLSKDPMPTFHALQREQRTGWLLSPEFGGGTANIEFALLTGLSMRFLPAGSIPYINYVHHPLVSVASTLAQKGYKTLALHPYDATFYNRDVVFDLLGFQDFIAEDRFPASSLRKGPFISDEEVTKAIIQKLEQAKGPLFLYAITMQNHGPYEKKRYPHDESKVVKGVAGTSRDILESYVQGVADADQSLKVLIDYLKRSKKPTVLAFFGDHLPALGRDFEVYTESGFLHSKNPGEWKLKELLKMHRTPLLVWNNFEKTPPMGTISPAFLGGRLLAQLHISPPPIFSSGLRLSEHIPGLMRNLRITSNGLLRDTPASYLGEEHEYWLLEYDSLFGKNYLSALSGPLGHRERSVPENMKITRFEPFELIARPIVDPSEGEVAIGVEGENFTSRSVLLINGQRLKTRFVSDKYIAALVPKELYQQPGVLELQVKILSSRGDILEKSNKTIIRVIPKESAKDS